MPSASSRAMSISSGNIEGRRLVLVGDLRWRCQRERPLRQLLVRPYRHHPDRLLLPGLTEDDMFFSYSDEDAVHILEVSASLTPDGVPLSALVAYNVSGDADDSFWAEATYDLGEMEETAVSVTVGFGNGFYTTTDRSGLGQHRTQHGQRRQLRLVHSQPRQRKHLPRLWQELLKPGLHSNAGPRPEAGGACGGERAP